MKPATAPNLNTLAWPLGFVAVWVVLQIVAVFNPRVVEVDPEEMFNAGQAWMLVQGHAADIFRLQYREFCGGCTLDAALAAPLFAAFGPRWLVWKLVPIGLGAATLGVGVHTLRRIAGPVAAAVFGLCFLAPPRAWLHLSLIGWGNHMEAGLLACTGIVVLMGAHRGRQELLAGVLLGGALWVGFSGAFAPLCGVAWLVLGRRWRSLAWVAGGITLGLLPWAAQLLSTGQHPFVTIYDPGESLPALARVPHKLHTLLAPRQLVALFGLPVRPWGWALGIGWALSLGTALVLSIRNRTARLHLLAMACWTAIYLVVRFQVYDPPWPEIAVPGSARYAAPMYPLAFVLLALAAARLHADGRKLWPALVALPLLAGLAARVETVQPPFPAPGIWQLHAVDWRYFRNQFAYVLPIEDHAQPRTHDPFARRAHAYAFGRESAAALLRTTDPPSLRTLELPSSTTDEDDVWEGIGDALAAWYQDRTSGSLDVMQRTEGHLRDDLDAPTPATRRALRAAAAWRLAPENGAGDAWVRAIDRHDVGTIKAVDVALRGESAAVQDAGWWAAGRRWALDVVGIASPEPLSLPATELAPAAFYSGIGHGLGEEWGPQATAHMPDGVPEEHRADCVVGMEAGIRTRWLTAR